MHHIKHCYIKSTQSRLQHKNVTTEGSAAVINLFYYRTHILNRELQHSTKIRHFFRQREIQIKSLFTLTHIPGLTVIDSYWFVSWLLFLLKQLIFCQHHFGCCWKMVFRHNFFKFAIVSGFILVCNRLNLHEIDFTPNPPQSQTLTSLQI